MTERDRLAAFWRKARKDNPKLARLMFKRVEKARKELMSRAFMDSGNTSDELTR